MRAAREQSSTRRVTTYGKASCTASKGGPARGTKMPQAVQIPRRLSLHITAHNGVCCGLVNLSLPLRYGTQCCCTSRGPQWGLLRFRHRPCAKRLLHLCCALPPCGSCGIRPPDTADAKTLVLNLFLLLLRITAPLFNDNCVLIREYAQFEGVELEFENELFRRRLEVPRDQGDSRCRGLVESGIS